MNINVNGEDQAAQADAGTPLLWVLREHFGLTGTKYGCGIGVCGACTVLIDGKAARSCTTTIGDVADAKVTTIEGAEGPVFAAIQAAWRELDVVQCGYCQSGQILAAVSLLTESPTATDTGIDTAMSGNLCRCATYNRIRAAIHQASARLRAEP